MEYENSRHTEPLSFKSLHKKQSRCTTKNCNSLKKAITFMSEIPNIDPRETEKIFCSATPPAIEQRPVLRHWHGETLVDCYDWLRAANWQEVLQKPARLPREIRKIIDEENIHADKVLANTRKLQRTLLKELKSRLEPDEADVPMPDGDYAYYCRFREEGQHSLYCRMARNGPETTEEILLDGDQLAAHHAFFDIGDACHSPDHRLMWWSADLQGSEFYTLHIRNLATGRDLLTAQSLPETIEATDGQAVWDCAAQSLYYVRMDENHRPMQVWRHRLGTAPDQDELIFEEQDPAWFVSIEPSAEGHHAIITVKDHDSTECHLLDLRMEAAQPQQIAPRQTGLRYAVEPRGDQLFIHTNQNGADDFKIMVAPLHHPEPQNWQELIAHRPGCLIVSMSVYQDFLLRLEQENGLPRIKIYTFAEGSEHQIDFDAEAYALDLEDMFEFDTNIIRFVYSSMTTPHETYDYHVKTHTRLLRKRQRVPSGHIPENYVTKRDFATAPDGEQVPVTLLYHKDCTFPAPVLLYGYGAYGHDLSADFSTNRLSLVNRGFIYALAHVRGGTDKGWSWYKQGKLTHKTNTFTDFIACAHHLIGVKLTQAGDIVALGGSAGGMLMGAVANMAPQLFAGIVADVPFVDVLNTMMDDTLPLTPPEWLEWGNPIKDITAFNRLRAYSPYDNIKPQAYPPILALAGLTDPRVTYWEPMKWVAKLRATMTGGGPVLLKTNVEAGHAGASGRFDQLEEIALIQAFALAVCGLIRPEAAG